MDLLAATPGVISTGQWLLIWVLLIAFSLVLWGTLIARLVAKARRLKAQFESVLNALD